jgi:hypothetical protein
MAGKRYRQRGCHCRAKPSIPLEKWDDEAVLVANLDRVAEAFGGDQRSDCTLAPSRSISASLLHVAAQTPGKWLIESTSTLGLAECSVRAG